MNRAALLAAAALLITALPPASASAQAPAAAAPGAAPAQRNADERLHQLFHDSDEAGLRRNPISAMFRGDFRYADHLGDYISDAYFAAEKAAVEQDLATLATIDRNALTPTDQLAYDVFKFQREDDLIDYQPEMMALTVVRPLNHFSGFHTFYPVFASGRNAAPFRNVEDYEQLGGREFVTIVDRAIGRFRQGLESGVVETKLTIQNVIGQLDTQLNDAPEASPYYAPVLNFPDEVPEAERARLRQAYLEIVRDSTFPAYRRLRDFLR
jgi:uncharacterized protein (DUF885 family)